MHNILVLLTVSFISAVTTFYVSEQLKQGPIRSSAFLSLLVAGIFFFFPHCLNPYLVKTIPIVFIGASFVGMVSARLLSSYLLIGFGGIIFCLLYLHASNFFNGYGGALGTSASIALLAVLGIPIVSDRKRLASGVVKLKKTLFKNSSTSSDK